MLQTVSPQVSAVPLLLLGVPPQAAVALTIDEVLFYVLFSMVLVGLAAHAAGLAQGRYLRRRVDAVARAVDAIARRSLGPQPPPGGPVSVSGGSGLPHDAPPSGPSSASEPTVYADPPEDEPPSRPSGSRRIP
jgi:hypothetical protein